MIHEVRTWEKKRDRETWITSPQNIRTEFIKASAHNSTACIADSHYISFCGYVESSNSALGLCCHKLTHLCSSSLMSSKLEQKNQLQNIHRYNVKQQHSGVLNNKQE
ncbi:hypothetical protein chiPu_0003604 [Chiloscyllium punctatum]|uniref:Uncharacterized protein n=1 Tax=Chiloscyllium punctatum TaxID=137246 RepID=A0A401S478_CHIPU|nr:hypothetical protein [Chiloscyllium punctatum]